ncbi:MAG: fused MFS/spermidine synthase, partial [Myxococcota bacterium]
MKPNANNVVPALLYLLAFLSGAAALIYQVAWTNMLALSFGSTTLAMSAVVAGFMGGMGIGAWRYHQVGNRVRNPLLVYGAIEIGIAAMAALFSLGFAELPPFFGEIAARFPSETGLSALRFAVAFSLLLIPSALMGATFPALCTALISDTTNLDRHLGRIYGWNTVGAASGAVLSGLLLIERLGLSGTVRVGNAINLCVGLFALVLWRVNATKNRSANLPSDETAAPASGSVIPTELPFGITATVLLLSGFTTIAYEVVWFRALRYLVGNSTYALSTVLVIFLLGLGLGSLLLRWVVARGAPERSLALCQIGISLLALVAIGSISYMLGDTSLKQQFSVFSEQVRNTPWMTRLMLQGGVAFAIMLPATLFMGLSYPLASRLFLGNVNRLSERIGISYLLANLGSIAGSVTAALWILPNLGTVYGTRALALINLALGILILARSRNEISGRTIWTIVGIAGYVIINMLTPSTIGHFAVKPIPGMDLAFAEEGDLATVRVWESRNQPNTRTISIDGSEIGHSRGVLSPIYTKQLLLAHLPMALDARIRKTLNIGLGSGSTLHTLASYESLQTMDVVEISGAVVRGSMLFDESEVYSDPRVDVAVDDAVNFLLRSDERYDLIISDGKQNEDFSGNGKILSDEFYRYALDRLTPEGLIIQWIPVGEIPSDFRVIIRTFCSVFPEVETFLGMPFSFMMVGSRQPLAGRRVLEEINEQLKVDLELLKLTGVEGLRAQWIASRSQLLSVVEPGPVNTWDHNILEFTPYKVGNPLRRGADRIENLELLLRANLKPGATGRMAFAPPGPHSRSEELLRDALMAAFEHN